MVLKILKHIKRSSKNVGFRIESLLYITNIINQTNKEQEVQICIGGQSGEIQLYEIEQQQHQRNIKIKSLQTFPNEHLALYSITSLLQLNEKTLISSSNSPMYCTSNL